MKMRNILALGFLCFFLFSSCSSLWLSAPPEEVRSFGAFGVIRETSDVAVIVDYEPTLRRLDERYFPIGIRVMNKDLYALTLNRESFVLLDENQDSYYMPVVVELQSNYDKLAPDHKFQSQTGYLGNQMMSGYSFYRRAESNFFPQTQGAGRVIEEVYIQRKGYIVDMIYFPMPPDGIRGKAITIRLESRDLEEPFEITFTIPRGIE